MYKYVLALSAFVGLGALVLPSSASAAFSVNLTAGYLRQNGSTALNSTATPNGALLLLIASGSANGQSFTATPNAGSYVAGGDVILGASSFNASVASSGTGKATNNLFAGLTLPTTTTANAYVELRWYPNITLAQYQAGATPTAGSIFGAYNPLATDMSGNAARTNPLAPDGGNPWQLPGDGTTPNFNFYTTDTGVGTQVVTAGYANFTVPVPEPSAGIIAGLGIAVIAGAVRRWKNAKTV